MRIILIFTIIFTISLSAFSQESCKKFRNGKFKSYDKKHNKTFIVTRKGNFQTEEIVEDKKTFKFEIKWINDCTYIVHPTKETIKKIKKDYSVKVEIIEIKKKSLILKVQSVENPEKTLIEEVQILQ